MQDEALLVPCVTATSSFMRRKPRDLAAKPSYLQGSHRLAARIDLLLICGGFAALICMNHEWLLNGLGNIDEWIYTGYFLHYDIPSVLADDKKIARLPWILSGFVLNRLFAPMVATQLLHAIYFLLSCTGVYLAIRTLLDRGIALLLALFCLFCVELYGPGGWDYHDLASGVFYLFSYIALANAAQTQARPLLHFFVAGILLALTAHTNVISINVFPVFVIEVIAVLKRRGFVFSENKSWITLALLGAFLGAAACTVVLGLINVSVGRNFFFFDYLFDFSKQLILDPSLQKVWWRDWKSLWWLMEIDKALYAGVAVFAVAFLTRTAVQRRPFWTDVTCVLLVEYLVALAVMLGWQMAGQTSLQPDYMAYPLMFPAFFALAALIARVLGRDARSQGIAVSWLCGIAFAAYVIFGGDVERSLAMPLARIAWRDDLDALTPFLVFTIGFAVVVALANTLRHAFGLRRSANILLFFCLTAVLAATDREFANVTHTAFQESCVLKEPIYASIIESNQYLFHEVSSRYHIRLWFSPNKIIGKTDCGDRVRAWNVGQPLIFGGIDSLVPWDKMTATVAEIPDETLKSLDPARDVVAVISETPTPAVELADELTSKGTAAWRPLRSKALANGPIWFTITIVGVSQHAIVNDQSS